MKLFSLDLFYLSWFNGSAYHICVMFGLMMPLMHVICCSGHMEILISLKMMNIAADEYVAAAQIYNLSRISMIMFVWLIG